MNQRMVKLALILCLSSSSVLGQEAWSLTRLVAYALENNVSVKQADIQARLAALDLQQSRWMQYPSASLSGSFGVNAGRSIDPTTNQFTTTQLLNSGFSLTSAVTVFNFFSIQHNIEGNRYDEQAARTQIERVRNDVALNVAVAYLQILVAQEQVNIANLAVQQTLQNLDNTSRRVEAGALPELNLAELEAQLARDSSTLITTQNTVRQNILQLKAILNMDAALDFKVEVPPLDMIPVLPLSDLQPETVFVAAVEFMPRQKFNELKIMAAERYVKAARAQMYPSFALFAGLGSNYANNRIPTTLRIPNGQMDTTGAKVQVAGTLYDVVAPGYNTVITTHRVPFATQFSDNFRQNIGIQVNIPLFNNGSARTAWQRSRLNVMNMQLQKDQDLLTLKQDIYTAYNDAVAAIQKFAAGKKSVETAEKAYRFAQKRYDLGLMTTIDLLTNQNNLNRARVELAQVQVDYVFRMKLLEFYKGQGLQLELVK